MAAVCKSPVSVPSGSESAISCILYSDVSWGTKGDIKPTRSVRTWGGCQDEPRRELRRDVATDGRDRYRRGVRECNTCVLSQTTEGGEKGGRSNCPGGLLSQLSGKVRNVSLILALVNIIIFFCVAH